MANLPLPKSGAALVAAMAGVSDVIKAKGVLWSLEPQLFSALTPACIDREQGERSSPTCICLELLGQVAMDIFCSSVPAFPELSHKYQFHSGCCSS